MPDTQTVESVDAPSRKGKIARRVFIGSTLLGGVGLSLARAGALVGSKVER